MSRWFRMYADALNNPKVQRLSGDDFKAWVNILCLAATLDGSLPGKGDIAFALRIDPKKAAAVVDRLVSARLLTATETGFEPHDWNDLQYKSDVSTERVKRFRKRSKQQDETVTETPPDTEQNRTDNSVAKATGTVVPLVDPEKEFWANAKAYLGPYSKDPGALIGKWRRDYGNLETLNAVNAAQVERASAPVPFIEKVLRKTANGGYGPGHSGIPL